MGARFPHHFGMIRERRASKIPRISVASLYPRTLRDSIDPRRRYFPLRAFFLSALSRGKQRELRCDIIETRASCFDNITSVSFQA